MAETVRVYVLLAVVWCRAAAQYPVSLMLLTLAQAIVIGLDLAAIGLIFVHTRQLAGFSLTEVMFLYGTATLSFSIADNLLGTADRLGQHVRTGTLDAMLVRPVSPLLQIATEDFSPRRLGRLIPATVVLALALPRVAVEWDPVRVLLVPMMIISGVVIFASLWVFAAAFQFVVVDGREAMNSITYGGGHLTQYPLSVYGRDLLRVITWVIPLAFVNWQPTLYLLDRPDPLQLPVAFRFASPVVAALLAVAAGLAWRAGLRRYQSTGS